MIKAFSAWVIDFFSFAGIAAAIVPKKSHPALPAVFAGIVQGAPGTAPVMTLSWFCVTIYQNQSARFSGCHRPEYYARSGRHDTHGHHATAGWRPPPAPPGECWRDPPDGSPGPARWYFPVFRS